MIKVIYDGTTEKALHKDVFGATIAELAAEDKDVMYLDADVMNSSGTYKFWQANPTRAINCGIAEANMMVSRPVWPRWVRNPTRRPSRPLPAEDVMIRSSCRSAMRKTTCAYTDRTPVSQPRSTAARTCRLRTCL